MFKRVFISDTNCITSLGLDIASNWKAVSHGISGIKLHEKNDLFESPFYGSIVDEEKLDQLAREELTDQNFTKLEKMLILALLPLVEKNKVSDNSLLVLSTTKGNVKLLKNKDSDIGGAQLSTLGKKVANYFGFKKEPIVISNACVSGLLAISVAKDLIQAGMCDNAFVLAGDEISEFILSGFNSFQAMSSKPCRPYDEARDGVTLGEASAAVFMDANLEGANLIEVLGSGAINDANHISGPSRTGEGLYLSILSALKEASIAKEEIDFISAHGTATIFNDEMEAIAFNRLDLQHVPVNSMKGYYGHTLGASGLLETVLSIESARHNQLIVSQGYENNGVSQEINVIQKSEGKQINHFLKTASGFGGSNTAILFKKIK